MGWKDDDLPPAPLDAGSPLWDPRSFDPCSSPCGQPVDFPVPLAASAAEPVPRKVGNGGRLNPLGTGSIGWSRFSPFVRWTLGHFFTYRFLSLVSNLSQILDVVRISKVSSGCQASKLFVNGGATCSPPPSSRQ